MVTLKLTDAEYCTLSRIVYAAGVAIEEDHEWDPKTDSTWMRYTDGGKFIFSCDKREFNTLQRLKEKI